MKKIILSIAVIGLLFSCSEEKKTGNTTEESVVEEVVTEESEPTEEVAEGKFYCPMKCEGEKMYVEAGTCPTCKMDLVSGEESEEEGHHDHDHEGHSH